MAPCARSSVSLAGASCANAPMTLTIRQRHRPVTQPIEESGTPIRAGPIPGPPRDTPMPAVPADITTSTRARLGAEIAGGVDDFWRRICAAKQAKPYSPANLKLNRTPALSVRTPVPPTRISTPPRSRCSACSTSTERPRKPFMPARLFVPCSTRRGGCRRRIARPATSPCVRA